MTEKKLRSSLFMLVPWVEHKQYNIFVFFSYGLEGEGLERERLEKGFEGTCFSCWLKLRIISILQCHQ